MSDAIAAATPTRSTIILAPGFYNPEPFEKKTPITIIGYGSTIEGARSALWEVDTGVDLTLKGLTLEVDGAQTDTLAIECNGSNLAENTRMKLVDVTANAGFAAENCEATFEHSQFDFVDQIGSPIIVYRSTIISRLNVTPMDTKLTVTNSLIGQLTFASGIPSADVEVSFSTILNGVTAPANLAGVTLSNNIISAGGQANAVVCASPCALTVSNNVLSAQASGIPGNFIGDPRFVNPANDFHLKSGSPAIDKANVAGPAVDKDGAPRPAGVSSDLGAFEFPQ